MKAVYYAVVFDSTGGLPVLTSEPSIQFQWEPSAVIGEGTFGKVFLGRSLNLSFLLFTF